jgi:hypothetical protein
MTARKPRLTKREKIAIIEAIGATTCGEDPFGDGGKTKEAALSAERKLKQLWAAAMREL